MQAHPGVLLTPLSNYSGCELQKTRQRVEDNGSHGWNQRPPVTLYVLSTRKIIVSKADTHIALMAQPFQLKSGFMPSLKSLAVMLSSLITRITLSQMSTLIVLYLARHGTLRIDRVHAGGTAP